MLSFKKQLMQHQCVTSQAAVILMQFPKQSVAYSVIINVIVTTAATSYGCFGSKKDN